MYISLVAKFNEIIDWKLNKFVPKYFDWIAQLSSIKSVWLHSSHMILGWLGDRRSGTWMFGCPSPASSWLREEHLVSISIASLILLSRKLSCKSIILTRFSHVFSIKSLLIQAKSSNVKNFIILAERAASRLWAKWNPKDAIEHGVIMHFGFQGNRATNLGSFYSSSVYCTLTNRKVFLRQITAGCKHNSAWQDKWLETLAVEDLTPKELQPELQQEQRRRKTSAFIEIERTI